MRILKFLLFVVGFILLGFNIIGLFKTDRKSVV
jgi:hypothetical protein